MNSSLVKTRLADAPIAVFDFETTGINPYSGHRIIEIGILTSIGGQVQETYETLVQPGRRVPEQASEINDIYDEDLEDAPLFVNIQPRVEALLENRVLVAHNAPFDLGFLHVEFRLARKDFAQGPVCDTVKLARSSYSFPNNQLGTICAAFDIENKQAHRALADVEATFEVFQRFAQELGEGGDATVEDWLKAQGGDVPAPESNHHDLPGHHPVASALEERTSLEIEYRDKHGSGTKRVIDPLLCHGNLLIAHCHLRNEQRTFRLDRIQTAEPVS